MEEQAAVTALAALAQEVRLRIFRALVAVGPFGTTPGVLSTVLDVPAGLPIWIMTIPTMHKVDCGALAHVKSY